MDGLIYASSMVMLDSAGRKTPVPALARWLLGVGVAATLAANVAHGLGHGPVGAVVAAWPTVALVGSYELLMMIIRSSQAVPDGISDGADNPDPLGEQAAAQLSVPMGSLSRSCSNPCPVLNPAGRESTGPDSCRRVAASGPARDSGRLTRSEVQG